MSLYGEVTGSIRVRVLKLDFLDLVPSYVYYKHPIFWLTQELLFSLLRLECGIHDKLHISSADWWDLLLLPLA